jgi:uncharacterized protein YggE
MATKEEPRLLPSQIDPAMIAAMKHLLLCLLFPVTLFAQGGLPSQPYLYVEGKAEIERPADMVTFRFDLVARNADQTKANQEVQSRATKILALLDEKKIAKTDVVASDLKSEPQYENEDDSSRKHAKIIGYSVTRPFLVKIRDVGSFPKLVDELIAFGGIEFSGIDAGFSDEKAMQDEIWKNALANARERAEKTLKEIGMKIESIFAVSPVTFPEIREKIFGYHERPSAETESALRQLPPSQYRLAPVSISQNVHVIYLISPVK